jgi:hypothetical protein
MPIHDWTKVDANLFHDFHQTWSVEIRNALNRGLLPAGYSALVEQHAAGVVPDVLALQRRMRPKPPPTGGGIVTVEPQTRHVIHAQQVISAARGNRVVIRHALGEVVSVIELVSPGNKSSRGALRRFVEKTVEVLVVDLFPPTPRDPQGIHKAIWDEIEQTEFTLPPDRPLTLVTYRADLPMTAYVEPVAVGMAMRDMPAYLDFDSYVPVPLEATYQAAWATCPDDMKAAVEHGLPPDEPA